MDRLVETAYRCPDPDEAGIGGFRLGRHTQRYAVPFPEPPRLTLRIGRDPDSGELHVRWAAVGGAAGSFRAGGRALADGGAFPFALTGLPRPGP